VYFFIRTRRIVRFESENASQNASSVRSIHRPLTTLFTGISLFTAGFSLIFRSWFSLVLAAFPAAVSIRRSLIEEMMMHETFGQDRESRAQKTWCILPYFFRIKKPL